MQRAKLFVAIAIGISLVAALTTWISSKFRISERLPGEVPGIIEYYADTTPGHALGIAEVSALPDSLFAVKDPCCSFGRPDGVVWLRFPFVNRDTFHEKYLVEVVNPSIPKIEFFQLDANQRVLRAFKTGTSTGAEQFRFRERPDTHCRNFRFPMEIARDSLAWAYFRITSKTPLCFRIMFFDKEYRLGHHQWVVDILMTIFYVFSVLFLILTAILIVASREPFHWYYFLYVLSTALFIPAHLGLGFAYVWKDWPELQHIIPMALNNLRLIFGIQFFRLYFDLPRTEPRFNRFIGISIRIFLATFLLQLIPHPDIIWVYYPFFIFLMLFSLLMIGWLFYELAFKWRRKLSWLLLVIALNFIGLASTSLQYLGYGSAFFDIADWLMYQFGIADTFFLSPMVIGAFFFEQMLVFNFAVRRYLHLIEKNQNAQLRVARAREEGLNALIIGVENERLRIARDLHDGACVNLAAINMKVDAIREELGGHPLQADKLAGIANDIEQTYREVRGISHDLMSKALEKTELQLAIEDLTVRIKQAQPGLKVHFYANYPLNEVGKLSKIHLYRIVQELLGNVLKHAGAGSLHLQLLKDEGQLLLTVEDDGKGFDPAANGSDGIGLANIRTRVEVLRGKMHLDSAPGKGTFVSIEIPKAGLA
ncbi:MAG: hypothetical protein IPK76_15865 [Lewinellaceae bacterium]|jgi:signal transduction histidine kinase|nr:hypothetical protein [Lewinellaceae bacterium]